MILFNEGITNIVVFRCLWQLIVVVSVVLRTTVGVGRSDWRFVDLTWLWRWLPLRPSKRHSLPLTTVFLKTTVTWTINFQWHLTILPDSNHLLYCRFWFLCFERQRRFRWGDKSRGRADSGLSCLSADVLLSSQVSMWPYLLLFVHQRSGISQQTLCYVPAGCWLELLRKPSCRQIFR